MRRGSEWRHDRTGDLEKEDVRREPDERAHLVGRVSRLRAQCGFGLSKQEVRWRCSAAWLDE